MPSPKLIRWFPDDFLHIRMLYRALHRDDMTRLMFVSDLALPYENRKVFIEYTEQARHQ